MVPSSSNLKRKILWSDDCNISNDGNDGHNGTVCDEVSRHAKAARTQLDIPQSESAALDRIIPPGDRGTGSDDHRFESQMRVEGARTRPSRREGIAWPEFPSTSPECCAKCEAMTGDAGWRLRGGGRYCHIALGAFSRGSMDLRCPAARSLAPGRYPALHNQARRGDAL
jgi:hypothetical protein